MPFILVAKPRPHVTLVTLNRPERMNAMSFDVMIPFRQALEEISRDNDTRVVVVTGAGAGFCSGADLVDSGRIPDIDGLTLPGISLRAMELLDDVILAVRKMHQPVIGAINGPAIGGGLCLSLAFDIRIAADSARFRAAGINNGLSSAKLGLSYLLGTCYDIAARITGWSQVGVELAKRLLWSGLDAASLEAHMRHEGVAQLYVRNLTGNFEEMIRARKDRRTPVYLDDSRQKDT